MEEEREEKQMEIEEKKVKNGKPRGEKKLGWVVVRRRKKLKAKGGNV